MSRVMHIGAADDIHEKARSATFAARREGLIPMKWIFGPNLKRRFLAHPATLEENKYARPLEAGWTLLGLPFEIKPSAPPDMLELDLF